MENSIKLVKNNEEIDVQAFCEANSAHTAIIFGDGSMVVKFVDNETNKFSAYLVLPKTSLKGMIPNFDYDWNDADKEKIVCTISNLKNIEK